MTVLSHIAGIVGAENVRSDAASIRDYSIDGVVPAEVVAPASANEVAEIVRHAAGEKLAVIATGARTKTGTGLPPRSYHVAVDVSRMNRILAYDPGDLTVSVEPGVTLSSLGAALAERKQFLPLSVPFSAKATIGGTIAAGIDSPLRQHYGTARDFLLGAEFVTGDGVIAKSGGRVVKNVTGYDLHKTMIGALGTLGIITKLNFKTFPLPVAMRGFVARFSSASGVIDLRNRIARSPLSPLTLEIFSPSTARLFSGDAALPFSREPMPADVLSPDEWAVTTGYTGSEDVLMRYARDLKQLAHESGATGVLTLSDNLGAAWARKREFIPIAMASSPATAIFKIGVLPSRMLKIIEAVGAAAGKNGISCAVMARGVGIIYVAALPAELSEESKSSVSRFSGDLQAACDAVGGHVTIPWCPTTWKSTLSIWGPDRPDLPEMRKLKNAFDPKGILSPGRFVGGI